VTYQMAPLPVTVNDLQVIFCCLKLVEIHTLEICYALWNIFT